MAVPLELYCTEFSLNLNSPDMFGDRRNERDRRQQSLPIPNGIERRAGSRREKGFKGKPWWLSVSYAEELFSNQASSLLNKEKIRLRK